MKEGSSVILAQVKEHNTTAIITSNNNYDDDNNDNYYVVPGTVLRALNYRVIQFLHQIYKIGPIITPTSY